MLPFQRLAAEGVELRLVGDAIVPEIEDYAEAVDGQTRAIAVSHVGHLTGARADLAALRALADPVGARLIVDVSHALGVVPVDGRLCDVLVGCCYKWLLGVHGVAIFAVNAARWPDLAPLALGWHAVENEEDWRARGSFRLQAGIERFEPRQPPFLALALLENGTDHLLAIGPSAIAAHVDALAGRLRAGLADLGLDVVTPEASARRAGNVTILSEQPEAIERALAAEGILVWAGEQRVRASVHVYNCSDDVDRLLDAMRRLAPPVGLRDPVQRKVGLAIVARLLAFRQLHLLGLDPLIGDFRQEVADDVEAGALLVVGLPPRTTAPSRYRSPRTSRRGPANSRTSGS